VLAHDLLDAMAKNQADFTLTFRRLSDAVLDPGGDAQVRRLFADPAAYDEWALRWRQRISDEPSDPAARKAAMRAVQSRFHSEESQGGSGHRCRRETATILPCSRNF